MDITTLTKEQLAKTFDFSLLQAYLTEEQIKKHCDIAKKIRPAIVAINSVWTSYCKQQLSGTDVKVGASVAFPLGQMSIASKLDECKNAIEDGADEIDYVCNIGRVKMHDWQYIKEEMTQLTTLCHNNNIPIKVIFENCYLNKEEIRQMAIIAKEVGIDYIKTSTGFGTGGATIQDVQLMSETVQGKVKVKAAGGIRSWQDAKAFLSAGASRLGTSNALAILEEFEKEKANETFSDGNNL